MSKTLQYANLPYQNCRISKLKYFKVAVLQSWIQVILAIICGTTIGKIASTHSCWVIFTTFQRVVKVTLEETLRGVFTTKGCENNFVTGMEGYFHNPSQSLIQPFPSMNEKQLWRHLELNTRTQEISFCGQEHLTLHQPNSHGTLVQNN